MDSVVSHLLVMRRRGNSNADDRFVCLCDGINDK